MSGSVRLILMLFAAVFAVFFVVKAVGWLLSLIVPVLAVIGVAAVLYMVVSRKALGGGSRRILP